MATRPFDFTGDGGHRLSGRLDLPDGPVRAYALFAHCFTCTKNSLAASRIARALTARGIGVLRFDFTGLGESGGEFAESGFSGNVGDLVAAAARMTAEGIGPKIMIGHSLGGAAVLAAASRLPDVAAVAVIGAPFDPEHVTKLIGGGLGEILAKGEGTVDLGGRPFKIGRAFIEDLRAQDQGARIEALKRPLLILHAPLDQIVDIDNASRIFLAARHPKSFVSLDHADHLMTDPADAEYAAAVIASWASRYLPAETRDPVVAVPDGTVLVEETGAGKLQMRVTAGKAQFFADEPESLGGLGSGPAPHDLLAAGLGACTAMTLRLYAGRKSWPLAPIAVTVSVGKSEDKKKTVFTRRIALKGDLNGEQRARLLEIADRCPVHLTLTEGALVKTSLGEAG